jgi:hypothetical protein
MLGPGDIETLTTRCNLVSAYYTVGRLTDVVLTGVHHVCGGDCRGQLISNSLPSGSFIPTA